MSRRARSDEEPLARAKAALVPFDVGNVPVVAWDALREVKSNFQLDLDLDLDHITPEACYNLAQALKDLQRNPDAGCGTREAFWMWMASSTDDMQMSTSQAATLPTLSRAKALIAVLAHALGCSAAQLVQLASVAGVAYLALLELDGAAQFWGTLFQPAILHQLLCIFTVPLCGESRRRRSVQAFTSVDALSCEDVGIDREISEPQNSAADALTDVPVEKARDLLEAFVSFLRGPRVQRLFHESEEFLAMVASRLSILLLHPSEEKTASVAAAGLAALVAGAGVGRASMVRQVAAVVIRSALPAVLMTQEIGAYGQTPSPSKLSQQIRQVALNLLCEITIGYPELLIANPRASSKGDSSTLKGCRTISGEDDPVLSALQMICVMGPDRAEYRAAAAESFVMVLAAAASSAALVKRAVAFLELLLASDRTGWRVAAAEASMALLPRSGELIGDASGMERARFDTVLLVPLVQRCRDVAPTVRAKAMGAVASIFLSLTQYPEGVELLHGAVLKGQNAPLIDLAGLFRMSTFDEKALVRRAGLTFFDTSLQVLRALQIKEESILQYFDVDFLGRLAADESVIVRKAAISSISFLLRECPVEVVFSLWVGHVLPLALDPEASVTEKAFAEIDAALLAPICKYSNDGSSVCSVPALLRAIEDDPEAMEYLKRVIGCLARRNQATSPSSLGAALLEFVQKMLASPVLEWSLVVWCMLQELAATKVLPRTSCELALEAWEKLESCVTPRHELLRTQVLGVVAKAAHMLTLSKASALRDKLRANLEGFTLSSEEVKVAFCILQEIEDVFKNLKGASTKSWQGKLAGSLDDWIISQVQHTTACDVDKSCRRLLVFGELVLMDGAIAAAISGCAVATLQALASNTLQLEDPSVALDSTIRGHAFGALGKLCLRREDLAKKSVELFVLHLHVRESFTVRNNVLIILRDLCERYTSLVDRFVACITDLLRDPNELLRKQSIMVLASLLSEDFIKFRGSIVHRFLYVLSDPCANVRTFVECIFIRILHPRNPSLLSRNFVDVVCGLNGWMGHSEFQSATNNKDFLLVKAPRRRAAIYRFMLSLFSNEQKFSVCSQMVTSFLTPFIDGETRTELPSAEGGPCGQSLHDVLSLLVCKEMRICFSPKQASQDDDADWPGSTTSPDGAEAARTALAGMFKRVMCEHVVPVLVQLKNLMETQHSPFLGRLRRCLSEILRDFKDDLQEILPDDPQLAGELAFDFAASEDAGEAACSVLGEPLDSRKKELMEDVRWKPLGQKRELCKTALNGAIRAAGKRRSLTTEMELNPNMDTYEESQRSRTPASAKKILSSARGRGKGATGKSLLGKQGMVAKRTRRPEPGNEVCEKRQCIGSIKDCKSAKSLRRTPLSGREKHTFSVQEVPTPQAAHSVRSK